MIFTKSFTQRFHSKYFFRDFSNTKYLLCISILTVLILSLASCAGGSRGTGILTMRVSGRILNTNGEIIEGLPLVVNTTASASEATTDSNGEFDTEILWRFGMPVDFELNTPSVDNTFSVTQIPENTVIMETTWEENESGEIVPTSINFTTEEGITTEGIAEEES